MSQELKATTPALNARKYRCGRCGQVYTSMMRLQHHRAAEHAPKTLKDVRTMRDILRSTRSKS